MHTRAELLLIPALLTPFLQPPSGSARFPAATRLAPAVTKQIDALPSDSVTRLAWVIRDKDCGTCASPAYMWRLIRARRADSVAFVVLVIGSDTSAVRRVLIRERIAANIQVLPLWGIGPDVSPPAMLLLRGRSVRQIWDRASDPSFNTLRRGDGATEVVIQMRKSIARR